MADSPDIARAVREKAAGLGFSACGFSPVARLAEVEPLYRNWLAEGRSGTMGYLERNTEKRLDPSKLVENASTIISLAAGYWHPLNPRAPGAPAVSRYALGKDYHLVLLQKGQLLLDWINGQFGPVSGRVFTDAGPIFEKEWAIRSGLGWRGKNALMIIPGKGSWFFLTELVIDLEIREPATPVADRCGSCTLCVDACPTGALPGDRSLDPRRCISYLTLSHKGDIPEEFRGRWDDWIYGCDICQEACPWNRQPEPARMEEFLPDQRLAGLTWDDLDDMPKMEVLIEGTPLGRKGAARLKSNADFVRNQPPRHEG